MTPSNGYVVFFFPQALEALGAAIEPYLQDGPAGPHVLCNGIDTGGSLLEMTIHGVTKDGGSVVLELMVPTSMVRMIVSSQSDDSFGFGPRMQPIAVESTPAAGLTAPSAKAKVQSKGRSGGKPAAAPRKPEVKKAKKAAVKPEKKKPAAKKAKRKPARKS